jgi:GNAT superfamily N-acetyltransferase
MKTKHKITQTQLSKKQSPLLITTNSYQDQHDDLNILKIETINVDELDFRVADNLAEKQKWMNRFRKAYKGRLRPDTDFFYKENIKFVIASVGDKEVGFLRLADRTHVFAKVTDEPAWNIADGYVKPAYQGQGVLRAMIKNAVKNLSAKSLTILEHLMYCHSKYYTTLDFTYPLRIEGDCMRLYQTSWIPIIEAALAHDKACKNKN